MKESAAFDRLSTLLIPDPQGDVAPIIDSFAISLYAHIANKSERSCESGVNYGRALRERGRIGLKKSRLTGFGLAPRRAFRDVAPQQPLIDSSR
jgi:hypothetical protein